MVENFETANRVLSGIEQEHEDYFKAQNKGILYFVKIYDCDGGIALNVINNPLPQIEKEIKKRFFIVD